MKAGFVSCGSVGDEWMGVEAEIVVIDAAQSGSEPAWRQLFAWHFDAVYRFCVVLVAGRRELAEETAQQVFVTAARQIGRFEPGRGEFRAWLVGIARHRFLTIQAKEQCRKRHEKLSQEDHDEAEGCQSDLHVHEALARLPANYRRALEGKYLKQLTMKEMADAQGVTIEAIESLLRRARDKFAQVYRQVREEEV